jgi:general secretion pathway protein N
MFGVAPAMSSSALRRLGGLRLTLPGLTLIGLALGAAIVGAAAALEGDAAAGGSAAADAAPAARKPSMPAAASPPAWEAAALVDEILKRPLFTPGRRPPVVAAAPPPAPIAEVPKRPWDWRLAGIMSSPERREALFIRNGVRMSVAPGDDIDGWKLVAIADDTVELEGDGVRKSLYPEPDGSFGTKIGQQRRPTSQAVIQQARTNFLAAAKKSLDQQAKQMPLVLHPRAQP